MSSVDTWHSANSAYLAAALHWLRLRLALEAQQRRLESTPPSSPPDEAAPAKKRASLFGRSSAPDPNIPRLPPPSAELLDRARVDEARAALDPFASEDPPPALLLLSRRLELTPFEREVLLLCLGVELDTRIAQLCARAQPELDRPYPTFALAMTLFEEPAWEALSPDRPLRHFRLLEVTQPGAAPLTASELRVDERILSFVKGLNYLDERIAPRVTEVELITQDHLSEAQRERVRSLVTLAHLPQRPPIVRLTGNDRLARTQLASAVCHTLGLRLLRLTADALPPLAELDAFARLWRRETALLPIALYLDASATEPASDPGGAGARAMRLLGRLNGLVFVDAPDVLAESVEGRHDLDVDKAPASEQRETWQAALGDEHAEDAAKLASHFNLNLGEIREIAARARSRPAAELSHALWRGCLDKTRPSLGALAQKIDAKATWADIVLPKTEHTLLRHIAAQVHARARVYDDWGFRARMNRGLGISALFAGESGTGKTMAAEVLATELDLDLYRIDLSAVVSKYIGETEKNLAKVFDAAEQGGAILFFDEADALFGKRSEVKDAHDRYANIEINYLLQRMEAFGGLAILASNMKSALDPAFVRRLRFILSFSYPAAAERQEIWQRAFPAGVPMRGLDYARLSRFNLTGGNIHNIALNAAFLAAAAHKPVSMPIVLDATRMELRKLERPINESELRWTDDGAYA